MAPQSIVPSDREDALIDWEPHLYPTSRIKKISDKIDAHTRSHIGLAFGNVATDSVMVQIPLKAKQTPSQHVDQYDIQQYLCDPYPLIPGYRNYRDFHSDSQGTYRIYFCPYQLVPHPFLYLNVRNVAISSLLDDAPRDWYGNLVVIKMSSRGVLGDLRDSDRNALISVLKEFVNGYLHETRQLHRTEVLHFNGRYGPIVIHPLKEVGAQRKLSSGRESKDVHLP
ncbi:hypothetical protein IW261DRAFT_1559328 [Armillaria novae-zelandiae]|uniref:Uncharacterized protein n=1 Tax=Armillaria novae-zelandiae TaxID=153914 RepID=A0AA39PMI6_9AGAR|nr:hypothetical protein IW261DRAFT_1559328 [Armillaria novae-zelandiae]